MRLAAVAVMVLLSYREAAAYRPFDGTDAAVADSGVTEIEVGPAQYVREGPDRFLVAPAAVLNYGFAKNWEAVAEGRILHGLSSDTRGTSVGDAGTFLKAVLRDGSLQDGKGPSIATEFGLLLPGLASDHGTGGHVAFIASQRCAWLTLHLNVAAEVTRAQHGALFASLIAEGPASWTVRPVAEFVGEREYGASHGRSALLGLIWQAREQLSFDVALRTGRSQGRSLEEIRAGVTFAFGGAASAQ
jgi:hypothetical protein